MRNEASSVFVSTGVGINALCSSREMGEGELMFFRVSFWVFLEQQFVVLFL